MPKARTAGTGETAVHTSEMAVVSVVVNIVPAARRHVHAKRVSIEPLIARGAVREAFHVSM